LAGASVALRLAIRDDLQTALGRIGKWWLFIIDATGDSAQRIA
jgi:hypothetical protein